MWWNPTFSRNLHLALAHDPPDRLHDKLLAVFRSIPPASSPHAGYKVFWRESAPQLFAKLPHKDTEVSTSRSCCWLRATAQFLAPPR